MTAQPEDAPAGIGLKTQLVRFVITGGASGVLDYALTAFFQFVVGFPPWASKAIGFVCGTTMAYVINRRWTFKAEPSAARAVAVGGLYAVTFGINVGLYAWLSHVWGESVAASIGAYVVAQGVATVVNFIVQRTVIFKLGR